MCVCEFLNCLGISQTYNHVRARLYPPKYEALKQNKSLSIAENTAKNINRSTDFRKLDLSSRVYVDMYVVVYMRSACA